MTVATGAGTTIPDARIRLTNLAAKLPPWAASEIIDIINVCMFRRRGIQRTPVKSKKATHKVSADIRRTKAQNPHMSEQELANYHGVNSARVSEAMIGRRV